MADEEKKEETKEETKEEVAPEKEEVKKEQAEKPAEEKKAESSDAPRKESEIGVPTESVGKEKPALSGKFKELIKQIETMSVADLSELVKALEDRFGVSAAAPVAVAGVAAAGSADQGAAEEEKSSYTVMLKDSGAQKIAVIKAVREVNQELGLKEAKDLVDGAPKEVKKDIPKADAEEVKKKLEAAGATVELV